MLKTLWRWLWRSIALFVAVVLIYQLWIFAHIWWWVDHNPSTSAFMEQRLEVLQSKKPDAELRHQWVPYNRISNNLKRALIAAEDSKFLDHEGFDWEGIQKAYEKNLRKGKIVAGGSTISQQLAKNLFLSSRKVFWRKAEEAVITVMLEKMMSKRRILEVYLNVIEWGNGVFGAEAAARHYYKTSASNLSAEQAARLASMVPNPRYFDTHRNSRGLERKTGIILARMNQVQAP
ncbi:MAG: monofunctional biosynthetic peptidoglycan transglycosylase [Gammaproteobacteria bacterium]|nr:monofunctional biosynthetic peptidoglycan transglycosylase [Gammaproteobacteria bacterium]MBU1978644.1 monofunctional biosynthetic peptidoglycan transglycosylase [Gammaproteobacteria bacterium]